MTSDKLDLSHLTPAERELILSVLERDDEIRKKELERIKVLKNEIRNLRLKSVSKNPMNAAAVCGRCQQPFGWLFNTGQICPKCHQKVCKRCRQVVVGGKWVCIVCLKLMELEAMTGLWFYSKFSKKKRNPETNEVIAGADIVKGLLDGNGPSENDSKISSRSGKVSGKALPNEKEGSEKVRVRMKSTSKSYTAQSKLPMLDDYKESNSFSNYETAIGANCDQFNYENGHQSVRLSSSDGPYYSASLSKTRSLTNLHSPFSGSQESIMSCYSGAGEVHFGKIAVTGEIEFALSYSYKDNILNVHVMQCRGLAPVDSKKRSSDPYVKCYLLPDGSRHSKRKTKAKRNSLNPIFNEFFKYKLLASELETRTLNLMVWHSDIFGRNDFLGEVNLPLNARNLNNSSLNWHKLQDRQSGPMSSLTYKGDLDISVKYVTVRFVQGKEISMGNKGELQVLVKQARNLTADRSTKMLDSFCKACLLQEKHRPDKQKSAIVHSSRSPVWNHTFVFQNISHSELIDSSVELTFWDHDRLTSNDFLGGIRLNTGIGYIQGKKVDWMDAKGDEVSLWQAMLDRPNNWIDGTLLLRVNMTTRR